VESDLARDYEAAKGKSRLGWDKAKHATRAAWDRVERAIPATLITTESKLLRKNREGPRRESRAFLYLRHSWSGATRTDLSSAIFLRLTGSPPTITPSPES
jgi:hypothetical protein